MQDIDFLPVAPQNAPFLGKTEKTTKKPPEVEVEGEWPRLLSKKWLAIHYDCWNGKEVLWRRFRSHVLTKDVLEKAGIDPEYAYSRHCKTFNAIDSLMLTKILRGFCLLLTLMAFGTAQAQTMSTPKYSRDTFVHDTIPGYAMLSDSMVRMVEAGPNGQYRFEKVLSTVVVDAYMVKSFRFLVRASDGGTDPFDTSQSFHLLTGGMIDPNRILIFKTKSK